MIKCANPKCTNIAKSSKPVVFGGRTIRNSVTGQAMTVERREPGGSSITIRGENGQRTFYLCGECTGVLSDWLCERGMSDALVPAKSKAQRLGDLGLNVDGSTGDIDDEPDLTGPGLADYRGAKR